MMAQPTKMKTQRKKIFPCKVKIDGKEYTSLEVCTAFGFAHRHILFNLCLLKIEEGKGKIGERTPCNIKNHQQK